jgi:hypothetical protein
VLGVRGGGEIQIDRDMELTLTGTKAYTMQLGSDRSIQFGIDRLGCHPERVLSFLRKYPIGKENELSLK